MDTPNETGENRKHVSKKKKKEGRSQKTHSTVCLSQQTHSPKAVKLNLRALGLAATVLPLTFPTLIS